MMWLYFKHAFAYARAFVVGAHLEKDNGTALELLPPAADVSLIIVDVIGVIGAANQAHRIRHWRREPSLSTPLIQLDEIKNSRAVFISILPSVCVIFA
jgi:hypothetical protein